MLSQVVRLWDGLLLWLGYVVGLLIVAAMLFVVVDVLLRYFFGTPIGWVIEVCEYFLLLTPFFGMAWLVRQAEGHIRIDILVQSLGEKAQAAFNCWGSLLVAVTLVFGTYYSAISASSHIARNVMTPGVYPVPKGYLMLSITLGFALTGVEFLRKAYDHYLEIRSL